MTITKFLMIDGALLLIGLPLLLILQRGNSQSLFSGNMKKEQIQDQTSIKIPNLKELLAFEIHSYSFQFLH